MIIKSSAILFAICIKKCGIRKLVLISNEVEINKKKYYPVSDVSLNEGTNGKNIWLYYTTGDTGSYLAPLSGVTLCSGDSVPDRADDDSDIFGKWEMLLDDDGNEVNVNDGVISWTYESPENSTFSMVNDSRLFLFIKRYGDKVKKSAKINRGYTGDKFITGELSLK